MEKVSYEFRVSNYSSTKGIGVGKMLLSDKFVAGGHQWIIRFYPQAMIADAYDAGYAALMVSLESDTTKPIHFLFELYILDQSGKGNHHGVSAFAGENPNRVVKSIRPGFMTGNHYFIKRSLLESSSIYLKDDCLIIRATIEVLARDDSQNHSPIDFMDVEFDKLLGKEPSANVFFKVAGESFCAHEHILAARCPVLLLDEASSVITDMEPDIFKAMLRFIYTRKLPKEEEETVNIPGHSIQKSFLAKLLAAAHQFELDLLQEVCELRLSGKVCMESAGYLLHLADLYGAAELKSACLNFVAENKAAFMESDGCEYLKETCPVLFLKLAGCKGVLSLCNKFVSTFKKSMVVTDWPWSSSYDRRKIKVL